MCMHLQRLLLQNIRVLISGLCGSFISVYFTHQISIRRLQTKGWIYDTCAIPGGHPSDKRISDATPDLKYRLKTCFYDFNQKINSSACVMHFSGTLWSWPLIDSKSPGICVSAPDLLSIPIKYNSAAIEAAQFSFYFTLTKIPSQR